MSKLKLLFFIFIVSFPLTHSRAMREDDPIPYDRRSPRFSIDIASFKERKPLPLAQEFNDKINTNGFVLLTNAIDPNAIDTMKKHLSETYEYCEKNLDSLGEVDQKNINASHISESLFKHHQKDKSLFDVLGEGPRFLCRSFFGEQFEISPAAHTRKVAPKPQEFHQGPIKFHVDSMYHGSKFFSLNFWTPLEECGKDKPTIQLCNASIEKVREVLKFNKDKMEFDPIIQKNLENGSLEIFERHNLERYYFPMEKGDILVFSNWTLHAGYANASMKLPRQSMELRYLGSTFDPEKKNNLFSSHQLYLDSCRYVDSQYLSCLYDGIFPKIPLIHPEFPGLLSVPLTLHIPCKALKALPLSLQTEIEKRKINLTDNFSLRIFLAAQDMPWPEKISLYLNPQYATDGEFTPFKGNYWAIRSVKAGLFSSDSTQACFKGCLPNAYTEADISLHPQGASQPSDGIEGDIVLQSLGLEVTGLNLQQGESFWSGVFYNDGYGERGVITLHWLLNGEKQAALQQALENFKGKDVRDLVGKLKTLEAFHTHGGHIAKLESVFEYL